MTAEFKKHDVEYSEWLLLGISGMSTELVIGTAGGVLRTKDLRELSGPKSRWRGDFLVEFNTSFEQLSHRIAAPAALRNSINCTDNRGSQLAPGLKLVGCVAEADKGALGR